MSDSIFLIAAVAGELGSKVDSRATRMGLTERRTGRLAALEGLEAALQVGDTAGAEVDTDRLGEAISGRVVGMETTEIQNELGTEEPGGPRGRTRATRFVFLCFPVSFSLPCDSTADLAGVFGWCTSTMPCSSFGRRIDH